MADKSFNVPVNQMSKMATTKANAAMRGSSPSVQMPGSEGNSKSPADAGNNLMQESMPKVVPTMTKPAKGATPPDRVNPMQRPGLGAKVMGQGSK